MAQKEKQGGRTATQILFEDAAQTLDTDASAIDQFASSVASMTEGPDPVFSPASLLKACERSADGAGLLIARAVERLGPSTKRATDVARRIEAAVDPDQRALIDNLGTIEPHRAFAVTDPHHDTSTVYLQGRRPGGETVSAHFFCETGFSGAATSFDPDAPADRIHERASAHPDVLLEELSLPVARAWLEHALVMREEAYDADPDDEDDKLAAERLPIVVHYFGQCPAGGLLPERERPTTDGEATELLRQFLTSSLAAGLDEVDGLAKVVVDFGMAVNRRPLWWSPTTVEIFGQYAHQVLGPEQAERLRPVTRAWAQWAGHRLEKSSEAIAATVAAVDHHLGPVGDQPSDVLVLPGVGQTGSDWFDDDDDDGFEAAWTAHEANLALFVRTSLAQHQGAPSPAGITEVAAAIRQGVRDRTWPHSTLADSSPPTAAVLDDTTDSDVVLWAVSAIIDPDPDLDQVGEEELTDDSHPRASVGALDSVDWATVIVEVVRAGPGMFCG
ncbi:MAG: hypothetical protein GY929_11890, partial [Actinomycetia bacterium]|nr:hypothetical protein [Actinomycetes bacterium]